MVLPRVPGQWVAFVKVGSRIDIQRTTRPDPHKGPVLDNLAKVNDITSAKSTDFQFFQNDEAGYESDHQTWTVTIPSEIADGQYVLCNETIASHLAKQENGAQNRPKSIDIEVTGGGSTSPNATAANKLYTEDDAGIKVSIYSNATSY
ncbi:hypothetical protein PMIN06_002634 [Paraphaeosphaeria minitans]